MNRKLLHALANLAFIVYVATCAASGENVPVLYLGALFALCSSSLLVEKRFNGPYSILCLFLAIYFIFFGLQDAIAAWNGTSSGEAGSTPTAPEMVILAGGVLAVLGYVAAVRFAHRTPRSSPPKDWGPGMVVIVGLVLWAVGSWAAWVWSVDLITDTKATTASKALSGISSLETTALMAAQMAKPLGMLMIAYAQTMYRRAYLLPVLVAVVVFQVFYGYVVDVKGEAMIGVVLVVLTKVLVRAKLPKGWLTVGVLFVALAFPVFQAHRVTSGQRGTDHAETARDIMKSIERALEAKEKVTQGRSRSQTFFERASLKGSVTTIVNKTGESVAYRSGYTLTPLLAAFIPKIIWADKPDVPTGRLMNADFHISIFRDTYISPSHLGELYWNFGWLGVLLGMPLIGFVLGNVGARCNLAQRVTLTRVLIMVVTIRYIVMGFEGGIAVSYVVWLRSIVGIGLLHLVLAKAGSVTSLLQRSERHSHEAFTGAGQTRTVSVP